MRQIRITDSILRMAERFRIDLQTSQHGYVPPLTKLAELKGLLTEKACRDYVDKIIALWPGLIETTPDRFSYYEQQFNPIISTANISTKKTIIRVFDKAKNKYVKKKILFYKAVYDAMRYDRVQSHIYPLYITQLGIKTCVYCNAQYAFSIDDGGFLNYEIDHYWPKSDYPYLCTTFMNLHPSCPACNKRKSDRKWKHDEEVFQLFLPIGQVESELKFELDPIGKVRYMLTADCKDLKIIFKCRNPKLQNVYDRYLKINTLYQAHTDVAEELIWKSRVYNDTFIESYREAFDRINIKDYHFKRFILGNYNRAEDIHMRPLSKMTQDIARQLGIIR